MKATFLISCFNEIKSGFLERNLIEHAGNNELEIICIDGGSTDETVSLLERYGVKKILAPESRNRAQRYNIGLLNSKSDLIVLVHPRSFISKKNLDELLQFKFSQNYNSNTWGAFTHKFDANHPLLKFTSWYSNCIRGDLKKIYYFDHCLFFNKNVVSQFDSKFIPEIEIFEDTELCLKLKKISTPVRLKSSVVTSAIRFKHNGIFKQSLKNQKLKILYNLGFHHKKLNLDYESKLELNGEVRTK